MHICENCNKEHYGTYGSGRFCSEKCARAFSTKRNRKEINKQVSDKLTGRKLDEKHKQKISEVQKGKRVKEETKKKISETKKRNTTNRRS